MCIYHGLRGLFALHTHGSWSSHEMDMSEVQDVSTTATSCPSPPTAQIERILSWMSMQVQGFVYERKFKSMDFVMDINAKSSTGSMATSEVKGDLKAVCVLTIHTVTRPNQLTH